MLAQWQQGEVDAAIACSAGSSLTAPVQPGLDSGAAPQTPATASTAAWEGTLVQPQQIGATWNAGCIPTVPSPGASPALVEQQRYPPRQRAVQAGIDEYDRTVRTLMSRVHRHGDILSAGGGTGTLAEPAALEMQSSHRDARTPPEAAGAAGGGAEAAVAVHQPFSAPQRAPTRGAPRSSSLGGIGSNTRAGAAQERHDLYPL